MAKKSASKKQQPVSKTNHQNQQDPKKTTTKVTSISDLPKTSFIDGVKPKEVTRDSLEKEKNTPKQNKISSLKPISLDKTTSDRLMAVLVGSLAIAATIWVTFYWIPDVVNQTDDAVLLRTKKEQEENAKRDEEKKAQEKAELDKKIAEETQNLNFKGQSVTMKTNFGELVIDLRDETAPKTVENFIRLTSRGYYNGLNFHRIAEAPEFYILQGGDPNNDGSGGESAFGGTIEDELWEVRPQFDDTGTLTNEPKLREPSLVKDYNSTNGTAAYKKGLIVMAKSNAPDSAGSQFFFTLGDSRMPADYTAFGEVRVDNLPILEKILNEVDPVKTDTEDEDPTQGDYKDGTPEKDIILENVSINPKS